MDIKREIKRDLGIILAEIGFKEEIEVEFPKDLLKGDFSSNVSFIAAKQIGKSPQEIASLVAEKLKGKDYLKKVEAVNGFINFYLSDKVIFNTLENLITSKSEGDSSLKGKKILVEYAHPNTHKELHIGHMRTLITGEAIAKLFESQGARVFRANYQGDIGPHVAKAIYGIQKIMAEKSLSLDEIEKWPNSEKAHFLGQGYARGSKDYEEHREEIDELNTKLYQKSVDVLPIYERTRKWSLDYYDEFYTRFYTHFDQLFFESDVADCGKKIVLENLDNIFIKDNGAIIFPGEKYGLHRRVFITKDGNPTYEGKDICLAFKQFDAFAFDRNIHVVASEQAGYFKVIIKALELLDPEKFKDKEFHLSMGMVKISDLGQARKMSSRTGDVLTVDWLLDQVKNKIREMIKSGRIHADEVEVLAEQIAIAAVKYSILKVGTGQDAAFDIEKSVSLDGDSGPYLQYTVVRTESLLSKIDNPESRIKSLKSDTSGQKLQAEEELLLRLLFRYQDILQEAALKYSPNILTDYLFDVAQSFNLFYQKHKIIGAKEEDMRISIVILTSKVLKSGLSCLGIKTPKHM